jgi:hypothetical protein
MARRRSWSDLGKLLFFAAAIAVFLKLVIPLVDDARKIKPPPAPTVTSMLMQMQVLQMQEMQQAMMSARPVAPAQFAASDSGSAGTGMVPSTTIVKLPRSPAEIAREAEWVPRSPAEIAQEAEWVQRWQELQLKAKLMGKPFRFIPHRRYRIAVDSLGVVKAVPIPRATGGAMTGPFSFTFLEKPSAALEEPSD